MFAATKPVERPNILFILADDLAAWMLGCYGNKEIKTPNIDNLARGGMRFANNFCCTPICSPSRATLLPGTLPRPRGPLVPRTRPPPPRHSRLSHSQADRKPSARTGSPAKFLRRGNHDL